ncbi:hypothetical protein [Pinirhizobacter soli]|uniref:hypothetical protein n=1 Tax=Pinirhizobacter soli TaxID=2786953 RepID=UPI00202A705E|nr:hypothetical protein [Pinirhizobacter soli]
MSLRRTLSRALVAMLLVVAASACSGQDDSEKAGANVPQSDLPPPLVVPDEAAAVARVSASLHKNNFTTLTDDCLSYIPYEADAQNFVVDVHERHSGACGGDLATSPRLFTYQVVKASGAMQTDATDPPAGLFHKVD